MATVRYRFDPANPHQMSPEMEARMAAMTEEEIERNALEDADNPPLDLDGASLDASSARTARRVRQTTGLSQSEFASRYRIDLARLRAWERGHVSMDSIALAYLSVIEKEAEAVDRALSA